MPRKPKEPKEPKPADPTRLVRETAGRYRSEDGRFEVTGGQGAEWYLADTQRANDFGLPLVHGPFSTLDEARAAVVAAAAGAAPEGRPVTPVATLSADEAKAPRTKAEPPPADPGSAPKAESTTESEAGAASEPEPESKPQPKAEPSDEDAPQRLQDAWLARLEPAERTRARKMVRALERLGVPDAERLVRQEMRSSRPHIASELLGKLVRERAIDPWADAEWLDRLERGGRGWDRGSEVARALRELRDAGIDSDHLADLATWIARRAARDAVAVAADPPLQPERAGTLPGWRLVELDEHGRPTGRQVVLDEAVLDADEPPQ